MNAAIWPDTATTVTAVKGDLPDGTWEEMLDATNADVHAGGRTATLDVADAHTWLWWWGTDTAGEWDWDAAAIELLARRHTALTDRVSILNDRPRQDIWPANTPTPAGCGVIRTLTDTQTRDITRMVNMAGGACFSVPGAGKTTCAYTTAAVLYERGDIRRMLVLAPLSAHEAWAHEPSVVFAADRQPTIHIKPSPLPRLDTASLCVTVVNYEALQDPGTLDALTRWVAAEATVVVFDEAHRVKAGRAGRRASAAMTLSRVAARTMVLTGTPRPNTDTDLENVLDLAFPGCGPGLVNGSIAPTSNAFVRTTKSELGLPELTPATLRVPLSPAHERIYDAVVDAATQAVIADPSILDDVTRAGRIATLLAAVTTDPTAVIGRRGPLTVTDDLPDLPLDELLGDLPGSFTPTKFTQLATMVDTHHNAGTKVLVWACFKSHIERLANLLGRYQPAVITGDVPVQNPTAPTDRTRELARFRNDPACTVLLATPHTLSEGVSLHMTTTHQIHVDRPYNAALFLQSLDRTHRLGLPADANCTTTYLVASRVSGDDTADNRIADALDRKVTAMAAMLNDPDLNTLALPPCDVDVDLDDVLFDGHAGDALSAMLNLTTK